ncbi:MAG TPA: type II toxin-antitoxin system HigB family toxin [Stellaceae bacterium]|nr:type II toxin-antitoxin system HigB family toxin [Stellaceae bacterium]
MQVIAKSTLRKCWEQPGRRDAEQPLLTWYALAKRAKWKSPAEIKAQFGSASIVSNDRVVFNIAGNKYRLIMRVDYSVGVMFVRFVGTHDEYDRVDAATV